MAEYTSALECRKFLAAAVQRQRDEAAAAACAVALSGTIPDGVDRSTPSRPGVTGRPKFRQTERERSLDHDAASIGQRTFAARDAHAQNAAREKAAHAPFQLLCEENVAGLHEALGRFVQSGLTGAQVSRLRAYLDGSGDGELGVAGGGDEDMSYMEGGNG